MQKLHTQKLAIIGTVGLPAKYGGFETLAQQLVLQLNKQFDMTVYCSGKTYTKEQRPTHWQGARLRYLPLKANGVQSILYDFLSMLHAIIFCDVLLVLGVSGCLFLPFIKMFSKKRVIVNVDGLEWRRPKWSAWARKFLQWSEWMATRYADEIVCDNAAIQKYVLDRYGRYSRLITYGADHVRSVHLTAERAASYSFLNAPYAFKVCRIEPENMLDMVLEAFAQSPTLPLVLVGNWDHSAYGKELRSKYDAYDHLHLLDPIYEPETLNLLRSNCQVYVHGHSAGGTNPSLVEAMYLGLPVLAYDVIYNRITTEHSAAFFDSAATLSAVVQEISVDRLTEIGTRMEQIARRAYNWQLISEMYAEAAWGEHSTPVPSFDFELPLALRQTFEPALKPTKMSSLIIFAVALALGLFTQPLVIRWADRHQHFDQTDDRKCHRGQISSLGGIAWFGASLLPVGLLLILEQSYFLIPLLACMLVLFGLSLWDDFRPLPALFRLGFQVILSIAIYLAGWQLPLGWLSFPATILFILLMINAYNFIDGINGLLGTISLLAFCGFGIIFSLQEQQLWALMSWSAAGGSLAFLRYNFGRSARIFMGDNGSTVIGLLLATFFLQSTKSITAPQLPTIIPALVLIALPILDLVRVVLVRLKQGHSPFHADRQHFHHLFVDFGWTAPEVCRLVIRQKLVLLMFCWGIPVLGFQLLFLLGGFGGLFWFAYQQVAGTTSSPTPVQGVEKPVLLGQSTEGLRA